MGGGGGRGGGGASGGSAQLHTDGLKEVSRTRSVFPETWLWSNATTR